MASTFNGSNAGTKPGLEIWRIEKKQPIVVAPAQFGSFHTGDCYIVLYTYKKSETSTKLDFDLHFWQGARSSQDERGYSAYFAVALDDFLGGAPVQYREVQGHESTKFLAKFPKGVTYLEGGVDTAFRHVDPDSYQPRLLQVKGKRNVRSVQVELSAKSLNEGDVFLLDNGLTIYQWNGATANRQEKFKALEIATKIKDQERGGKAKLIFLESSDKGADQDTFFKILKGTPADVKKGSEDDAPAAVAPASLWRLSDNSGPLKFAEVAKGKLEKAMLDENDVFLLDAGGECFVWIGSKASKQERSKGMEYGAEYLKQHNKPDWTQLTRLPAGGETPVFKSKFVKFDTESKATMAGEAASNYVAPERKLELGALLERQHKAEEKMLDASGQVEVWKIKDNTKVAVPKQEYGQFNSGDSYIVKYLYKNGNRDSYVLYMWHGRNSRQEEQGTAALLMVELAKDLVKLPGAQVRVTEGREPTHFLALFKGKFVVRSTSGASDSSASSFGGSSRLFQVRGSSPLDARAVETAPKAESLNGGDCFVLLTPNAAYVWQGQGANASERTTAHDLAKEVLAAGKSITQVVEGSEPADFWTALGGKKAYVTSKELASQPIEPRLFQLNGNSVNFQVEELDSFTQDDLTQEGVFILDTFAEVYVWLGERARAADKNAALQMATKYVHQATDGRSKDTPIVRVVAGAEPPTFTAQFRAWSNEKAADFEDPYVKKLAAMRGGASSSSSSSH